MFVKLSGEESYRVYLTDSGDLDVTFTTYIDEQITLRENILNHLRNPAGCFGVDQQIPWKDNLLNHLNIPGVCFTHREINISRLNEASQISCCGLNLFCST